MALKGGVVIGAGLLLAAGLGAGWWFGAPLYTLNAMQTALEQRDASRLSQFVDYDALREDLRGDIQKTFSERFGGTESGILGGASLLAMAMVDPVVDQMISPEGMSAMMGLAETGAAGVGGVSITATDAKASSKAGSSGSFSIERQGFDTLRVQPEGLDGTFALVFSRRGLGWKLTGVDVGTPEAPSDPAGGHTPATGPGLPSN
jgi:hypothetical protein